MLNLNLFQTTISHLASATSASDTPSFYGLLIMIKPEASKRKRSPSKEPPSRLEEATAVPKRPKLLHLIIPAALNSGMQHVEVSSPDSLFSGSDDSWSLTSSDDQPTNTAPNDDETVALRTVPPIPGLYFEPDLRLPQELADLVTSFCMKTYFTSPLDNQVMLFGRFPSSGNNNDTSSTSGFPNVLLDLLDAASELLHSFLPPDTYELLFPSRPTRARQAIINLYQPGEGITPHVDLLRRYGDGIFGISFSSGSVMRFDEVNAPNRRWDAYLPERSIIVMTGDARYKWTHGIEKKTRDLVSSGAESRAWIDRGTRMSVTFRWLLPGADIVGE